MTEESGKPEDDFTARYLTKIDAVLSRDMPDDIKRIIVQHVTETDVDPAQRVVEERKWRWTTPIAVALTGLITTFGTFIVNVLLQHDTAYLTNRQEEVKFQFDIVREQLPREDLDDADRAKTLLFLARSGVLNYLNQDELKEMAKEAIDGKDVLPNLAPPIPTDSAGDDFRDEPNQVFDAAKFDGFVIHLKRMSQEEDAGAKNQIIGKYEVYYKGTIIPELTGTMIESPGAGTNKTPGVRKPLQIGTYTLYTHNGYKFTTIGYSSAKDPSGVPKPAIGIRGTGARMSIIIGPGTHRIHPIGAIYLVSDTLPADNQAEDYSANYDKVVALISTMKQKLGAEFPDQNGQNIPHAWLFINRDDDHSQ
jgi:hypothetical protein